MSVLDTITNNTILIPYHDSLVDSNPLPAYDVAKKLETVNAEKISTDHFEYAAYIKLKDGASVKLIAIQEVLGFGMERENKQMPNSTGNYTINLPGPMKYTDITIKHLYTSDSFFLDWVENGVMKGGSARVDMELHFWLPVTKSLALGAAGKKHIAFTLYDAFPINWELEDLSIAGGKALFERVIVTFSRMDYKVIAD